ncbi:lysine biosynthesis protein LysW [Streptomyces sp. SPB074]|uniref:lysine biosynthesis protein LysW n=1 Tax=Streptomyces sp. (strain SPB074) TaxID=465543 RepID=UPI00017F2611|nr:lysine biosynthesis protein LysW [Streptomyces sp. SPB074]EDY45331.1 lysine biosynthesis protein LysW [Streptomyces sp. SPB074]
MTTAVINACPECAQHVAAPAPVRVASIVVCPSCSVELEVICVDPVEYALAPEIEEDFGE